MSNESSTYCLRIIQATELPRTKHNHLPNAYVKVRLTDFDSKTKVVKRSRDPCWNEVIQFVAKDRSSKLSLDIMHDSTFSLGDSLLGSLRTEIGDLLDKCAGDKEVELDLSPSDRQRNPQGSGRIKIHICLQKPDVAVVAAITDARKDASTVGIGSAITVSEYVDNAQTAISSQSGTFSALGAVLSKIDVFVNIVDRTANVHPYAKLAWQIISSVYKIVRQQITTDQKLIGLIATMENVYSFVDAIQLDVTEKVKVLEETIKRIFTQTVECGIFIREYTKHGFTGRTIHGTLNDNAGTIEKLCQHLLDLKKDFDSGVTIQTAIFSFRTHGDVSTILRKQTLLELEPAKMEASGRTECLPSTRQDILSEIVDWATSPSGDHNVFWLYGLAGSGKSTLSTTIASYFRDLGRLGAFVFFDRAFPERSHPSKVIRTLAYKLGSFDPRIGTAISAAIDNFPSVNDASLRVQFTKLLIEPLTSLTDLRVEGPIVLVLDALDECGNPTEREALLTLFSKESSRFPSVIRVIVTSRELDDITAAFRDQPNIFPKDLEVSSKISGQDILTYFEYRLGAIRRKNVWLQSDWPGHEVIRDLGMRSWGLFVWASTTAKFIDGFDPEKRLAVILQSETASGAQSALDDLYKMALEISCAWDDVDFVRHFRTVLGMVLVFQNPLTVTTLDRLIGLTKGPGSGRAISSLACLVAHDPTIHLLHPSFADFLFSRTRCGREMWHFNAAICHENVALLCLDRLSNDGLKRNICNLTLSAALKGGKIPDDVAYACMFWIDHICLMNNHALSVIDHLEAFLKKHLLHWLEVMSIMGKSKDTIPLLSKLYGWTKVNCPDQNSLSEFVRDAWRFVQTSGTLIEDHPLLIYFAALPFTPTTSTVYQTFYDTWMCPTISGGFQQSWSSVLLLLSRHTEEVSSVAFSPDGTRIVSGSFDKTVRVWDAMAGNEVIPPLRGHTRSVQSVAFSPDGTRIVSGSEDTTVRVWDTMSGNEVISPLRGHEFSVKSVAFSPDGTRIVSGSIDRMVRVWDAVLYNEVIPPLRGHGSWVQSVAFSPDGTWIVSGSDDNTVRVWDAVSGKEVIPPLQGHKGMVKSVAFSPDGTQIVSGSDDKTVRVWDSMLGIEVIPPLRGHKRSVQSVAFSPDGTRIVSGSDDQTVRVWDATSGNEVIPPLRGHNNQVRSVEFSPDGTRIVSGSDDKTVCVWDAVSGNEVIPQIQGHDYWVRSVAFSLDGTRIVSGSDDRTVRVWDAVSGNEVIPPLQGHNDLVLSVAFSPNGTQIVSGSGDQTVRVWDAMSGNEVIPPLRGHNSWVRSVAFSPDGTRIISGSDDKTVRVWDAMLGKEVIPPLQGHKGMVRSVAFSPDGTRIVSGSFDLTVRVWDAVFGNEVIPPLLGHDDAVQSVAFSPDGTLIVSESYNKTKHTWDAITGLPYVPSGAHANSNLHNFIPSMIVIKQDRWVVSNDRTISKLPAVIPLECSATSKSGNSLAIGTARGQVHVLNFPPAVFSSLETRPAEAKEENQEAW